MTRTDPNSAYRMFWLQYLPEIGDALCRFYKFRWKNEYRTLPVESSHFDTYDWKTIARRIFEFRRDIGEAWEQAMAQGEPFPWPSTLLVRTTVAIPEGLTGGGRTITSPNLGVEYMANTLVNKALEGQESNIVELLGINEDSGNVHRALRWMIGHYFECSHTIRAYEGSAILEFSMQREQFDAYYREFPDLVASCRKVPIHSDGPSLTAAEVDCAVERGGSAGWIVAPDGIFLSQLSERALDKFVQVTKHYSSGNLHYDGHTIYLAAAIIAFTLEMCFQRKQLPVPDRLSRTVQAITKRHVA